MDTVTLEIIEPQDATGFIEPFLRRRDAAERPVSGIARVLGVETLTDQSISVEGEMGLDLLAEILVVTWASPPHTYAPVTKWSGFGGSENASDGRGEPSPLLRLAQECLTAGLRQLVEPGLAIVV